MAAFKKIFRYGKGKMGFMAAAMILSGIATVLSLIPYYYFWQLLKEITKNADFNEIRKTVITIFVLTLAYVFTYFAAMICSHIFAFRVETNMKKEGVDHLLNASFSFFDMNSSGRTRKIVDDNTGNTHTVVAHMLPDSVNAVVFPIGFLILSFMANVYVGILVICVIVFSLICFKFMYNDPKMMKEYMGALENINSETVEYVRSIQIVKIYDMVISSFEKLHRSILKYSEIVNRETQKFRVPYNLFQMAMIIFPAIIIAIGHKQLAANQPVSEVISMIVFFMTFAVMLNSAFVKIMFFSKNYQMGQDAVGKLEELFKQMDDNKLANGDIAVMDSYSIEFDNVSFGYEESVYVLKDFDLRLDGGKTYALVGASGCGKSTIAKLISGFYPVTGGSLKIGGRDIKEYKSEVLEKNIAFVFQNSKLFKTSIYENVKIGNPEASHDQIMAALENARCGSILEKFPDRENTIIGSKGVHLSGGEMQRVAIARAILKDAPVIIMDEASAASDPENEYEMQQAFSRLMKGKTVIMIAHRLSSIRDVDEILVIDKGKVIERGGHDELVAAKGKYLHFQSLFNQANEWRL